MLFKGLDSRCRKSNLADPATRVPPGHLPRRHGRSQLAPRQPE